MRAKRLKSLVAAAALALVPFSSYATVDWNEDFEYAAASNMWAVWVESCQSNPTLSTDRAHSGSKSLKLVYTGAVGVDPGAGGCFMDRYLNALSDTIYMRVWMWLPSTFQVNSTGTKMINIIHSGFRPNYWTEMLFGQKT